MTADNEPLDDAIMSRLMDVSVTDNKSGDADELSLTLDDHDGKLAMPKRGIHRHTGGLEINHSDNHALIVKRG